MNIIVEDTIVAISTATGGALSVIRVSGANAINITDKCFSKSIIDKQANTTTVGDIYDANGQIIDNVVVSLWRAPHSYTGEDVVEISCHGSTYISNKILNILIENGCRMAQHGEFTKRAYLNGKMDLSQSEAVADLIASTNKATHDIAMSQLRGHFSSELNNLREQLLKLTSLLELELDFSDHEDLEFADRNELLLLAKKIEHHIAHLANTFETGQAIKNGIPVAIVGKTNVGKSTLLNRLLHDERAIVSDIHGTTRDTIEDTIDIQGVTFRLIDTAGIRQSCDEIESIGIERTYSAINKARIILWLFDSKPSETDIIDIRERTINKRIIPIHTKVDIKPCCYKKILGIPIIQISAKTGQNIDTLENYIYKAAEISTYTENEVIITNVRHYEALKNAQKSILHVIDGLVKKLSGDLLAEDLRLTLDYLAEITGGKITTQETLNNIFSNFCVGK